MKVAKLSARKGLALISGHFGPLRSGRGLFHSRFSMYQNVHPSIFWSILRGNGAHTPDQDLESYKSILMKILTAARHTESPLGRGSSHAPSKPVRHIVFLVFRLWLVLICGSGQYRVRSGGLSRCSTHQAPWCVAHATPRTCQPSSSPPPSACMRASVCVVGWFGVSIPH